MIWNQPAADEEAALLKGMDAPRENHSQIEAVRPTRAKVENWVRNGRNVFAAKHQMPKKRRSAIWLQPPLSRSADSELRSREHHTSIKRPSANRRPHSLERGRLMGGGGELKAQVCVRLLFRGKMTPVEKHLFLGPRGGCPSANERIIRLQRYGSTHALIIKFDEPCL